MYHLCAKLTTFVSTLQKQPVSSEKIISQNSYLMSGRNEFSLSTGFVGAGAQTRKHIYSRNIILSWKI